MATRQDHSGKPNRGHGNDQARAQRPIDKRGDIHARVKHDDRADRIVVRDVRRDGDRDRDIRFPLIASGGLGFVEGCPPGLAKKDNGCMPPGQAKKLVGNALPGAFASRMLSGPYSQWYRDNDRHYYRMGDGLVYQVNRSNGLVDALIPYGMNDYGYYPVGYSYPDAYDFYNVPMPYRGYYPADADMEYRYGGGAIYAVDPQTQLVSSIVSLLAGDLAVGQPMPAAYNVYNVPLAYRDRYYDTPNDWYRYNDGSIYRVDPTTQLITAVISALV